MTKASAHGNIILAFGTRDAFTHGEMAEWSKAPVLKTGDVKASVGSNPTLSARKQNTRKYPSGRRGSPAKGVGRQKRREGSNPSFRASKKRHPKGCLFLLHAADFALPPVKPPVDKPDQTVYTYCHQKGSDEEEAVFPRPKRGAPPAESTPPRTRPVPLPSRLRRAGRVSPVTAIESDGVCRISSADTALQKLEIQTVFLRSCALSRRKISRHPQRTVKMLRRP